MSYAHASEIEGDYLEFGVWRGRAFSAACYLAKKRGLADEVLCVRFFLRFSDKR